MTGGSERHCRVVAEHLASHHDVTMLTSCAQDYVTWRNVYPPGVSQVGRADRAAVPGRAAAPSRPARGHQRDRLHHTLVARRTGTVVRRERARGARAHRVPAAARRRIRSRAVLDLPLLPDLLRAAARRRSRDSGADGRRGSAHLGGHRRSSVRAAHRIHVSDARGSRARSRKGVAAARAILRHRVRCRADASLTRSTRISLHSAWRIRSSFTSAASSRTRDASTLLEYFDKYLESGRPHAAQKTSSW